ncbi:MAG: hypothetical protein ACRD2C_09745 [Acidimicrobiales bacterium]
MSRLAGTWRAAQTTRPQVQDRRARRRVPCALVAGLALVGALVPASAGAAPSSAASQGQPVAPSHGGGSSLKVGAASRSVLPLVDGSLDYTDAGFPSDEDAVSPGIFVPEWDDGSIAVGNGDSDGHWVRDDLRVRAVAIDDRRSDQLVVLVATDLYMVFRTDGDVIRSRVAELLPRSLRHRDVEVVISATHNHHGPDTAFDVNHDWYDHMVEQAAQTVVEAIDNRVPATLRVAEGEHYFGLDDGTDPQVIDPRLNVLQAVREGGGHSSGRGRHDDRVIATLAQWNNHPETTLNWRPPVDLSADCAVLGWTGDQCHAEGRYFTADYPGVWSRRVEERYGGEALYFVGALGVIVGPGGAPIWEVDRQHPVGDGFTVPPGAAVPGGGSDYTAPNFRRAVVQGEVLADATIALLRHARTLRTTRASFESQPFYTRLSNIGFRLLLVVDPATGRSSLGHEPGQLYTCPATGPKTGDTCEPDDFAAVPDPILGQVRAGDHLRSEVGYLRIGDTIGMMFLPAEVAGELVVGLPADFRTDPGRWYLEPPGRHAFGDDFQIPGYVLNRMHDRYEWTIGLGNDEMGYAIPLSNWRVSCVADQLAGPGTCQALHDAGVIEFPDAVAGATCKAITEDPSRLDAYPPEVRPALEGSCRYGQALGEAEGHYEETNSAGWDLADDILAAVAALTGDDSSEQVNRRFPGYHIGNRPDG